MKLLVVVDKTSGSMRLENAPVPSRAANGPVRSDPYVRTMRFDEMDPWLARQLLSEIEEVFSKL